MYIDNNNNLVFNGFKLVKIVLLIGLVVYLAMGVEKPKDGGIRWIEPLTSSYVVNITGEKIE